MSLSAENRNRIDPGKCVPYAVRHSCRLEYDPDKVFQYFVILSGWGRHLRNRRYRGVIGLGTLLAGTSTNLIQVVPFKSRLHVHTNA